MLKSIMTAVAKPVAQLVVPNDLPLQILTNFPVLDEEAVMSGLQYFLQTNLDMSALKALYRSHKKFTQMITELCGRPRVFVSFLDMFADSQEKHESEAAEQKQVSVSVTTGCTLMDSVAAFFSDVYRPFLIHGPAVETAAPSTTFRAVLRDIHAAFKGHTFTLKRLLCQVAWDAQISGVSVRSSEELSQLGNLCYLVPVLSGPSSSSASSSSSAATASVGTYSFGMYLPEVWFVCLGLNVVTGSYCSTPLSHC